MTSSPGNFLHHDMTPVDPLLFRPQHSRQSSAHSQRPLPAVVHATEPITHDRGLPPASVVSTGGQGRYGYCSIDHFSGAGLHFEPTAARPSRTTPQTRQSTAASTVSQSSRLSGFYTGEGTTQTYPVSSSGPVSPAGSRHATPSPFRRRTMDRNTPPEQLERRHQLQSELQTYHQQYLQEQQQQQQQQKVDSRKEKEEPYFFDPVVPHTPVARIPHTISDVRAYGDKEGFDHRVHTGKIPSYTDQHAPVTPQGRQYLVELEKQMEAERNQLALDFQTKLQTTEIPIAATLESQHTTPQARLPRNHFIQTSLDHTQIDRDFKQSRSAETEQYRADLHAQIQADHERRQDDHARLMDPNPHTPLRPPPEHHLMLKSRLSSDHDGVKITNEDRIHQHVEALTREHTPLGDRLGRDHPSPIHRRPVNEEDRRKLELQRERVALLDELRREREVLQQRLKQEEHALNQMEAVHYPFHQPQKTPTHVRYTKTPEDPVLEARRSAKKADYIRDLKRDREEREVRLKQQAELDKAETLRALQADPWRWNTDVDRSPKIPRSTTPVGHSGIHTPLGGVGEMDVNPSPKPTRLASLQKEDDPPKNRAEARAYHAELDQMTADVVGRRSRERQRHLNEEIEHMKHAVVVKLDPKLHRRPVPRKETWPKPTTSVAVVINPPPEN